MHHRLLSGSVGVMGPHALRSREQKRPLNRLDRIGVVEGRLYCLCSSCGPSITEKVIAFPISSHVPDRGSLPDAGVPFSTPL